MEEPMLRELIAGGLLTILIGCLAAVAAQNTGNATPPPDPNQVRLVGDRFKPLAYAEMTPPQKKMLENLLAGERRGAGGPFNVLLRSPEMGDLAQQFGASMRFHSSIPRKLNEMAIIITARHWTSHYEWYVHKRAALDAGLGQPIVDAIAAGKRPTGMAADEQTVYDFCTELLTTKQVGDRTFQRAKDAFGERGVVDLIGVSGYYGLVSMLLNTDRYPLPEGVKPELKPLN
jgi:4-carboxymuconolactone decarboxylase